MSEPSLDEFCQTCSLKSILNKPTRFKNPKDPSCIDLVLTDKQERFLKVKTVETGLLFTKWWFLFLKQASKIKSRR